MKNKITIIGGGISGITTALTLQLSGFDTICCAEHLVDEEAPSDPRFASLYPAASVIPHSVQTDRMDELFPPSQKIFRFLLQQRIPSIKLHRHYEVYEFPKDDPPYASFLDNYERLENSNNSFIPRYAYADTLSGWSFNCLVAECPAYIHQLYKWYKETGGTLVRQKVMPEDISNLNSEIVVNCSGLWSSELFDDPGPSRVIRGHVLYIKGAQPVTHPDGPFISYNYTPATEVYSDTLGNPCDVYFYPRSNGWVLGGSRQPGIVDRQNIFEGKDHKDAITINGVSVPRQILELNRKILGDTFNINLDRQMNIEVKVGYRFTGNLKQQGLRLDCAEAGDKKIIHNYGHGGAGVTLSWGCALGVLNMILDVQKSDFVRPDALSSSTLSHLQSALLDLSMVGELGD